MAPKKRAPKKRVQKERAVLIYDGECPVCRRIMAWIEENQKKDSFEAIPCRSDAARERFPFMEDMVCMRAMQLILPDGRILSGEKAVPEIVKRLKRYGPLAEVFRLPGSEMLSRALYRWLAAERYHVARVLFPGKDRRKH